MTTSCLVKAGENEGPGKKKTPKEAVDATRTTSENSAGAVISLDWMTTLVTRAGRRGVNIGLEIALITTANHNNLGGNSYQSCL